MTRAETGNYIFLGLTCDFFKFRSVTVRLASWKDEDNTHGKLDLPVSFPFNELFLYRSSKLKGKLK